MKHSAFQRIWLPGFMLQSVVIGGGYATGRELVEFFLSSGPLGGLAGIAVATVLFGIASALTFEFARLTMSANYRRFFAALLGKGWFLYEIPYVVLVILVLAVIGSAAGEMVATHWHVDSAVGTLLLVVPIGILVFRGTPLIEKALAGWSFLLYATYALLVVAYLWTFGGNLVGNLAAVPPQAGWFDKGVRYFGYNLAAIPIVLFCVRHMTSRQDTFTAGLLAGPLVMLPALMFYLAMSASYPDILDAAVPADYMMRELGVVWLQALFYVVVFGTFVETGTAFIHAINERVEFAFQARSRAMPRSIRPAVAVATLLLSVVLAVRFGIIDLIARGYGLLTWAFIAVFALPLATVGAYRIWKSPTGGKERRADAA